MNTSTGATVTIDGRDTGLNPSDGYDPNPDDSDISSMKVIGTGAGRTEIHDLPAGWKAMGGVIRRPDGHERREYTLTSPDGGYTAGYAFEWNTKPSAYTKDDLRHVTAGTDGKRVDGFDPTRDGTYKVPDGSRVTIENLPAGWKVEERHSPDGMILTYTVSSPDGRITVVRRFESDRTATPGTGRGDGDPADPDMEDPKGVTGAMEAGLPDTGIRTPAPWIPLLPATAGLILLVMRRHRKGRHMTGRD